MSFFPLPNTSTIKRGTETSDRSGQKFLSYVVVDTVKCLFYAPSGTRVINDIDEYKQSANFYVEPIVDIREGDIITDILDGPGNVIEAGPYMVDSVKKVMSFGGKVHHISCKIKGVTV
jgi:hypothetical protein